ncbi:class D beta-lactamase [Pararhizobium antarcticum]|uniref:beta-lactamase n=1 Tax=Pararhizobium antarcticum TaxID=1798805 RepID=A0A657LRY9_9HYPH|nr:class D beta-lactamase [Pararhizobium antarcticum]OJF96809.1 class D beta-lactamase [Pararhizobium antarcticum]OJF98983.1 class D beta-lactamase [Rhizobium sp. 58]
MSFRSFPGIRFSVTVLALSALFAIPAQAATLCTVIADAKTGDILVREGKCDARVTPASTFKIPLAVMGYDSGFLTDGHTPTLPFRKGDPDWGGDNWKQPTDAVRWLKYSVVWFSQRMTAHLGAEKLTDYARRFDYGNADLSGDPGRNNGLERAWIASSLKISPIEQVTFLRRLINHQFRVSDAAVDRTVAVVEGRILASGWAVKGKTGMAYPRDAGGRFDRNHPWGWYVGWGKKGDRTIVFARLVRDDRKTAGSAGFRARDSLFQELPSLLEHK